MGHVPCRKVLVYRVKILNSGQVASEFKKLWRFVRRTLLGGRKLIQSSRGRQTSHRGDTRNMQVLCQSKIILGGS